MSETRNGGCLCGAVRFTATLEEPHYHACHCATCRGWGGPAMAAFVSAVEFENIEKLSSYDSSDYGERLFCSACGTHIAWRMKDRSMHAVWIGALDDGENLEFESQIFIDRKPGHYAFANKTKDMTGEEVMAAAQADQE